MLLLCFMAHTESSMGLPSVKSDLVIIFHWLLPQLTLTYLIISLTNYTLSGLCIVWWKYMVYSSALVAKDIGYLIASFLSYYSSITASSNLSSYVDYYVCQYLAYSSWLYFEQLVWDSIFGDLLSPVVTCCSYFIVSSSWLGLPGSEYLLEAWRYFLSLCQIFSCRAWYGLNGSSPDNISCWTWCGISLLNPEISFQWERVGVFPAVKCTVSEKLSCCTWNCSVTISVSRLRTRETDLVCLGDGTRYIHTHS